MIFYPYIFFAFAKKNIKQQHVINSHKVIRRSREHILELILWLWPSRSRSTVLQFFSFSSRQILAEKDEKKSILKFQAFFKFLHLHNFSMFVCRILVCRTTACIGLEWNKLFFRKHFFCGGGLNRISAFCTNSAANARLKDRLFFTKIEFLKPSLLVFGRNVCKVQKHVASRETRYKRHFARFTVFELTLLLFSMFLKIA